MSKRPSFQYYPADKQTNVNLRRCTWAERGVWWYLLDFFHDSDEYGILRWTLEEIATALGCEALVLQALVKKGVLKGADKDTDKVSFSTTIAKKNAPSVDVELIPEQNGPLWYSSRMVRDEYIRNIRAIQGVKSLNNPNVPRPKDTNSNKDKDVDKGTSSPSPTSSSSTTSTNNKKEKRTKKKKVSDPNLKTQALEVLKFLNLKADRQYREVDTNLDFIAARLDSGVSAADCRAIIAKKCREWKSDPEMDLYLRPATLFNKTKFEQYLGELLPEEKPDAQ